MTIVQEATDSIRLTRKPEEAAPMLGISKHGVYALINSGQLRCVRLGRKIIIPLSAIHDFLNGREVN